MNWETSQVSPQRYTTKRSAQMLSRRTKASTALLADWTKQEGACFPFSERWTHLFFFCSSGDSEILSSSLVLLQGHFLSFETTSILRKRMATEVKRSLQVSFSRFPLNNSKSLRLCNHSAWPLLRKAAGCLQNCYRQLLGLLLCFRKQLGKLCYVRWNSSEELWKPMEIIRLKKRPS